mmetsp:Transcript_17449/g.16659  ORF Transcript_17449/g.16659 Transcript_17449/m.16659 type:complete len:217 (-) Transcript_17449:407-1057(-)|eukprot:CAMPEP_0170547358 /NCGR_PEP_ID=MMETSP0211-20121228/5753_1 /TAXON_ID=311385 /ORGANISM="Pseudokeronopsis sp., Strain OXSARD2" /LENGTH=216 /DNA_ID=CAMNT_0010852355 /DNA_START=171 /DNA_END=821 /DNA_ORIENTATION=-
MVPLMLGRQELVRSLKVGGVVVGFTFELELEHVLGDRLHLFEGFSAPVRVLGAIRGGVHEEGVHKVAAIIVISLLLVPDEEWLVVEVFGSHEADGWVELYLQVPLLLLHDELLLPPIALEIFVGEEVFLVDGADGLGVLVGDHPIELALDAVSTTSANLLPFSKVLIERGVDYFLELPFIFGGEVELTPALHQRLLFLLHQVHLALQHFLGGVIAE